MSDQQETEVSTYQCKCGQFVIAIVPSLDDLPRRSKEICKLPSVAIPRDDGKCVFTLYADKDRRYIYVKRLDNENEQWYPYKCQRCQLILGYDLTSKDPTYTYILADAVSELKLQ
ncbi:hypothetical protein V1511DRAFT_493324 [Dipodascopsis uninucleata]